MKYIFSILVSIAGCHYLYSQELTAYAITSEVKGSSNWQEVRKIDLNSGSSIRGIYLRSSNSPNIYSLSTGKLIFTEAIERKKLHEPYVVESTVGVTSKASNERKKIIDMRLPFTTTS